MGLPVLGYAGTTKHCVAQHQPLAALKGVGSLTLLVLLLGDWKEENLFMILPVHFSLCVIKRLKNAKKKTLQNHYNTTNYSVLSNHQIPKHCLKIHLLLCPDCKNELLNDIHLLHLTRSSVDGGHSGFWHLGS